MIAAGLGFLAPEHVKPARRSPSVGRRFATGCPTLDDRDPPWNPVWSLDAAFQRVGDEMKGPPVLARRTRLVTLESQMGIPRAGRWVTLAPGPVWTSPLAGGDDPLDRAVRHQHCQGGTSSRTRCGSSAPGRRGNASQKTTVKLVALILFIFPAILVVLAGPAASRMISS